MKIIHWRWFMREVLGLFEKDKTSTRGYRGFSFLWFIIIRDKKDMTDKKLINHETIHFEQQKELLFVFQWLLYLLSTASNWLKYRNYKVAYRKNVFEMEAHANEYDLTYLSKRKKYAWFKYTWVNYLLVKYTSIK